MVGNGQNCFQGFLFHGSETEPVLPQNQSGWQETWHRFPWTLEVFILGIYELMDFIALKKSLGFCLEEIHPPMITGPGG